MHIGIDTVTLKGEGFHPRVKLGDTRARRRDPLIAFDLDFLATHAKSLLTQVVIANSERRGVVGTRQRTTCGREGHAAHVIARRRRRGAPEAAGPDNHLRGHRDSESAGLHARPAAVLANLAKGFRVDDHAADR